MEIQIYHGVTERDRRTGILEDSDTGLRQRNGRIESSSEKKEPKEESSPMTYPEPIKESLNECAWRSIPSSLDYEERSLAGLESLTVPNYGIILSGIGDRGAFLRKIVESSIRKHRARIEFLKEAFISHSEADLAKAGRIMMDPSLDPARLS